MATTNDLKNGMTLNLDGQLWNVIEFQHVKPGKGGAFVRTKMRSLLSGKVVEKTFNAGVKVEVASVEKRDMQFLYRDGEDFIFMDSTNYDQISISKQIVQDAVDYMLENSDVIVAMHEGNPLFIELPASVELVVTYTEPGLQGDRSSGGTKPATVETGITVQVPLFIKQDEKILVDTRTGAYLGRAN
jgi:elongation factor P